MRWLFGCILLIRAAAQTTPVQCVAPRETIQALEAMPSEQDLSIRFEDRIGPRRALARKYPNDIFIQHAYQSAFRRSLNPAGEFDRALEMYKTRPGWMPRYLEARLLLIAEPAKSRATFERLLAENPGFAWPYLDMLEWSRMPGARNVDKAEAQVKAFIAACPDAPEAYDDFTMVQDAELIRIGAENLRAALVRRDTVLDLARWPILWKLERRAGVEAEVLNQQIRADLAVIEAHPFQPRPEMAGLYRDAAEILRDPTVLASFEAVVEREAPRSTLQLMLVRGRWARENPPAARDATQEQRKTYQDKWAGTLAVWHERWPDDCALAQELWLQVQPRLYNEVSPDVEKALSIIDGLLKCRARSPDAVLSVPPIETITADAYVRLNARLEQVPRLLDAGFRASEREQKYRLSEELIPAEMRARARENDHVVEERTQFTRADYFVATGRLDEARTLAEQEISRLSKLPVTPRIRQYTMMEWRRRLAAVAEKQGRSEEALSLYRSTLRGVPRAALSTMAYPLLVHIKQYYLAHGGAEDQWLDWASAPGDQAPIERSAIEFVAALPEFTAKDLTGRSWRLDGLKGKATLINIWATWCAPCRGELPELQKLHDTLKDRKDFQILTLNLDEDPAALKRYLDENAYTFPVIRDLELADRLFPYVGLPTNLLVNSEGRRTRLYGFETGEAGLNRVIGDMENAVRR